MHVRRTGEPNRWGNKMEAEWAHQDSQHTVYLHSGLSANLGARRHSEWVGGYYAAACYTKRLGGADSQLQICTTFQVKEILWALIFATHITTLTGGMSQIHRVLQIDKVAVLWVKWGWTSMLSRADFNPSYGLFLCEGLPAVSQMPCLPIVTHGYRWFTTQQERTRLWNVHHSEQWFFLKSPVLEHHQKGLWRVYSNPFFSYTRKLMSREEKRLIPNHLASDRVAMRTHSWASRLSTAPGKQNKAPNSIDPVQ